MVLTRLFTVGAVHVPEQYLKLINKKVKLMYTAMFSLQVSFSV